MNTLAEAIRVAIAANKCTQRLLALCIALYKNHSAGGEIPERDWQALRAQCDSTAELLYGPDTPINWECEGC